ncbi:MAG: CHAT domain-containing protein [Acidobacteriota bacterium]
MATPRVRLSTSPGWEVVRADARRAAARAAAQDPFLAHALATRRLSLASSARVRPRRGAPPGPGRAAATIEGPESDGFVAVVRHASGALTFHRTVSFAGGAHVFDVPLASPARRGPAGTVALFFLRVAGAAVHAALPFLARAWERRRFAAARAPLGLVRLTRREATLVATRAKGPLPPGPGKCLLFLHGTFSHAAAAFDDLAKNPSAFDALVAPYGGRVYAFNHLTVGRAPGDNVKDLRGLVAGARVDVVTHSRGGLVLRALAAGRSAPWIDRAFLAASPSEGTPLASPARWDEMAAWIANLAEALPSGTLVFGLDFAAEALVWIARRAGGALPGIAAMDPAGEFLADLNARAPGRTTTYGAAVADFKPEGGLARRLLDAGADAIFRMPHDLVVPTEGGLSLGRRRIEAKNTVRFAGDVHHLNLFAQRETKEGIKNFLEGEEGMGAVTRRASRPSQPSSPPKKSPGARSALPSPARSAQKSPSSSRFDLLLVDGAPPRLVASWAGARVVEPFETRGGAAGERMRKIIALHERVLRALDGRAAGPLPKAAELQAYGAVLFETLFPGEVRRLWDAARGASARPLELAFTSALDWIADKPWELAWDPSRRRFLSDDAVLVRNVFGAIPPEASAPRRGPLRVLVAVAQPRDATPVSARLEVSAIRAAFAPLVKSGHAVLDVLPAATPSGLHHGLAAARVDVLHFVGHGAWDEKERSGALLLVDGRGRGTWVDADRLRRLLCGRGLRLVVLNACETGRGGRNDFLRGVAPALLAGGIPAVVANQYKVLDTSATAFARHLMWALARGHALGEAAREARVAVSVARGAEPMDWAVPVLYARDTSLVLCRPARR